MTTHMVALIQALLLIASLATTSLAQTRQNVMDIVTNNANYTPKRWKTKFGGQNFTWCCIQAIADSLTLNETNNWVVSDDPIVRGLDLDDLQRATDEGQFPCTAKYESDVPGGAPDINVPYIWLAEKCPGWELSSGDNLNAWLQPLSGFLLPAVIFCLSVPRRRKLHVFRAFFVADLAGITSYVPAFLGAVGAMILVTVDTIIWLSVCWALSGPMILSGLYEALLDNRVIDFVREKQQNRNLTLDMRCRLLMLVLIGNLDLALEDDPFSNEPANSRRQSQRHQVIEGTSPPPDQLRRGTIGSDTTSSHLLNSGRERSSSEALRAAPPSDFEIKLMRISSNMSSVGDVGEIRQRQIPPHADHLGVDYEDSTGMPSNTSMDQFSFHQGQHGPHQQRTPDIRVEPADAGIRRTPTDHLRASPWRHMEELLYPIRLYDDEDTDRSLSPRQYPTRRHRHIVCQNTACIDPTHFEMEKPLRRTSKIERQIRKTKTRLRTMLNCQYSFGSMVGAPVVFFLGGFVFALLQSIQSIGDEDTALALAFGQWYMTIPHIAIISGLLLAGNNPNILEGVFATQHGGEEEDMKILGLNFGLAYPSCYKVAWQWHRGHNKLRWIHTLLERYGLTSDADQAYGIQDEHKDHLHDLEELRDKTTLSPLDWSLLLVMAAFLLGVPFALAFITAFYTPEVGLSCRSFTFTIYACAELGQVLLWLWAYAGPPGKPRRQQQQQQQQQQQRRRRPTPLDFFRAGGWLHANGFYNPKNTTHFLPAGSPPTPRALLHALRSRAFHRDVRSLWCCLWYALYAFFGSVATLAALGGTVMQLLGVYTADICYLTVDQWVGPYGREPQAMALISRNSRVMIEDAQTYWKPCAITAIAFMTFVSFVGWWYQRRMKDLFTNLVSDVDEDRYERGDTRESKRPGTPGGEEQVGDGRNLSGSPGI